MNIEILEISGIVSLQKILVDSFTGVNGQMIAFSDLFTATVHHMAISPFAIVTLMQAFPYLKYYPNLDYYECT